MSVNNKFIQLLSYGVFKKIANSDALCIAELNTAIALLIKLNIDFNFTFTSGTRASYPTGILTISINPNTQLSFEIEFDSCCDFPSF